MGVVMGGVDRGGDGGEWMGVVMGGEWMGVVTGGVDGGGDGGSGWGW